MNELYGSSPGKVIEVLNRRRISGYRPGDSDGDRVGLIVEGGSMRGAISSGALAALRQLGYRDCFDEVWGTSSGAINAAYFVSGQIDIGTTIYHEIATDPAFINIWRWPDILDIDWLIDNLTSAGKMLDIAAVMESAMDLYISATDIATGNAAFFSNRDNNPEILIPALRASVCAPLFTNRTERIGGRSYNDGMIQEGIPVAAAAARCTHLVAVLTRQVGYRKRKARLSQFYEYIRLRRYPLEYRENYHRRHIVYNQAAHRLFSGPAKPYSLVIAPARRDHVVGNSETRARWLKRAIRASMDRVEDIFSARRGSARMRGE